MSKRSIPLYSSLAEDSELRDQIDHFVVFLAEQIDGIQDALCAADLELLGTRTSELAETSLRLGFSLLADAARSTADACAEGKSAPAEDGVVEITQLGQRIRLGHRGAA